MNKFSIMIIMVFSLAILIGSPCFGEEDIIHGCYKKNHGQLRRVSSADDCSPSETYIWWNKEGPMGQPGIDGINCWDLNENGICDPDEDKNDDGCGTEDCQGPPGPQGLKGDKGDTGYFDTETLNILIAAICDNADYTGAIGAEIESLCFPKVVKVHRNNSPLIPSGWKATCYCPGPGVPSNPYCPVIEWLGHTYWVYSRSNNYWEINIVAYDEENNIVGQWIKSDSRYVSKITMDPVARTLSFIACRYDPIVMDWNELRVE